MTTHILVNALYTKDTLYLRGKKDLQQGVKDPRGEGNAIGGS